MKLAFDEIKADFSGIYSSKPLSLSQVLHRTLIEVSQEGTEASAATAVVTSVGAGIRLVL